MNTPVKLRPAPHVNPEVQAYWEGASQGKLLIKECKSCGKPHFYPRDVCPYCMSTDTAWLESKGLGEIYSLTTMMRDDKPHTVAYVRLDEGVTMMSNLIECDASKVSIGQRVKVLFVPTEGHALAMFTPL